MMRNRNISLFMSVFMVVMISILSGYSLLFSHKDRQVSFNGSFVLLDQEGLFSKVDSLSSQHEDRNRFVSEIKKLLSSENLIESYSIRYSWPKEVIVNIREVSPLAILNNNKLITGDCKIFEFSKDVPSDRLMGFFVDTGMDEEYMCEKINTIIPYIDSLEVGKVSILSNGNYRITVNETDYLIAGANVPEEINRMLTISGMLESGDYGRAVVDLRYSSGGAIQPM